MSLAPLTSNLGVSRAKHLLRRAFFHYNKDLLYTISSLNVDEAINYLDGEINKYLNLSSESDLEKINTKRGEMRDLKMVLTHSS